MIHGARPLVEKTTWSKSWEMVPGIGNPSPLRGEEGNEKTILHGFRVGGLRRAAAPPVATARGPSGAKRRPVEALRTDQSPALPSSIPIAEASASALRRMLVPYVRARWSTS